MKSCLLAAWIVVGCAVWQVAAQDRREVQPVRESRIALAPWQSMSQSPFLWGGWRSGGADRRSFRFTPDGESVIGMDGGSWRFERFQVASGAGEGYFGRTNEIISTAISPDGRNIIGVGSGKQVHVWSLDSKRMRGLDEGVNFAEFSAVDFVDRRRCLLAGVEGESLAICIWDIENGNELERAMLPIEGGRWFGRPHIKKAALSASGATIGLVEGNSVVLRDRASGQVQRVLAALPAHVSGESLIDMVAFSRDGRVLAVTNSSAVRFYDVIEGVEHTPLALTERVRAIQFSDDGKQLRCLSNDGRVQVFLVADLLKPQEFEVPRDDELKALLQKALTGDVWENYVAISRLSKRTPQVVGLIAEQLTPAVPFGPGERDRLLRELGSANIEERKLAMRAFQGREEELQAALQEFDRLNFGSPRLPADRELRSRLRELESSRGRRSELEEQYARRQQLATLLVLLGTPEARDHLKKLAGGAPTANVTRLAGELLANWPEEFAVDMASDVLLECLASDDSAKSYAAACMVVKQWPKARELVKTELAKQAESKSLGDDRAKTDALVEQLNSDEFKQREAAVRELQRMGRPIETFLRAKLAANPTAEVKSRLELILGNLQPRKVPVSERLTWRLLEIVVLAEGRDSEILREVAKSAQGGWLRENLQAIQEAN